jgi:hypothetical protein
MQEATVTGPFKRELLRSRRLYEEPSFFGATNPLLMMLY